MRWIADSYAHSPEDLRLSFYSFTRGVHCIAVSFFFRGLLARAWFICSLLFCFSVAFSHPRRTCRSCEVWLLYQSGLRRSGVSPPLGLETCLGGFRILISSLPGICRAVQFIGMVGTCMLFLSSHLGAFSRSRELSPTLSFQRPHTKKKITTLYWKPV